jgi:hypothetical protein
LQIFDCGEVILKYEVDADITGEGYGVVEVLLVKISIVVGAVYCIHEVGGEP